MAGERSRWNNIAKTIQQHYHPDSPIEHISLHAVGEMIKVAEDETTLLLADYYLLSISQACANPSDEVQAHREKFFPGVRFRTLQDGLSQLGECPNAIL